MIKLPEIKLPPGILPYLFGFPWERKPKPTEVPLPGSTGLVQASLSVPISVV